MIARRWPLALAVALCGCAAQPRPQQQPIQMTPYYQERVAPRERTPAPKPLLPCYEELGGAAVFRKQPCI